MHKIFVFKAELLKDLVKIRSFFYVFLYYY